MQRRLSVVLVVLGFIVAGLIWVAASLQGPVANVGETGGFLTVTAVVFLVAGALIANRTPRRWTGPLVQVVALTTVLGAAGQGDLGTTSAICGALWLATILVPAVLVLDHPDGISERWLRWMLAVAVAITAGLAAPIALAAHGTSGASTTWWNTPKPHGAQSLALTLFTVHTVVTMATLSIVVVVLTRRLAGADRALRRLLNPVWIPGMVWALVTGVGQLARLFGPAWALDLSKRGSSYTVPALFLFVAVPCLAILVMLSGVVWTQLVIPRLPRTAAGLAIDAVDDPTEVTRYVAAALGDPSAMILFRTEADSPWVDSGGRPAAISETSDRAVMVLRREGVLLGAIEFDAALAAEPDAVELGATVAAFAVDNARLVALATAQAEVSRRLTARLVTASEAVRAELRKELDEGPLQELRDIDLALARGGDPEDAADGLQKVTAHVRKLSHGVFPPELTSGGLSAALPYLPSPVRRYAPAIEVTAFLAASGDTDARILDAMDHLRIELSRPPGDASVLDRVAVLGGTVEGNVIRLPVQGRC